MTKKRHHYVPRSYLNSFCNKKGKLHVYLKDNPESPLLLAPGSMAFRNYYYSQPIPTGGSDHDTLENLFSALEGRWPKIVGRFSRSEDVTRDLEDIYAFIALQRARVPAARDAFEVMLAESVKTTMKVLDRAGKLPPMPKGFEDILDNLNVSIDPHQSIHAMVTMIQGTGMLLDKLGLGCLHNRSDLPFLTGDNPVIWFDPSVEPESMCPYTVNPKGPIVFMFPVAPTLMIYGHSEIRDRYARHGFGFAQTTRDQVEIMNRQICRFAYEAIYASAPGHELMIAEEAHASPVLETSHLPTPKGIVSMHRHVFGTRSKLSKWRNKVSQEQ